jgi:hypothetical protein
VPEIALAATMQATQMETRESTNALDYLRDFAGAVAAGNGDLIYTLWVYSHPPGDRRGSSDNSTYSGPNRFVIE